MRSSWKAALFGAAVVTGAAPAAAWSVLFGTSSAASDHDRGTNGVHVGPDWLAGDGSAKAGRLAMSLHGLGLRTVYAEIGVVGPDGELARRTHDGARVSVDEHEAASFLADMGRAAPDVRVLPIVGGQLSRDVRPADVDQQVGIARTAVSLVEAGAPGVHLSVPGTTSGTPGFLPLVRRVKADVGDAVVSVRATMPGVGDESLAGLAALCGAADALVVPLHGTGANTRLGYEAQVAWTTRRLADTLAAPESGGCAWSLEVPTVDRTAPAHDPTVETLSRALAGVRRGLGDDAVPVGFAGVVVQDARTTSVREWGTYEAGWRGRPGTGVTVPGGPDGV